MARPRSRFGGFFGNAASTAGGYAAGAATADTLRPVLQELVNVANKAHPVRPFSTETAAAAEIVAGWTAERVREEAHLNALSTGRADAIRAMAGTAPDVAQLLATMNRLDKDEAWLRRGLRQLRIRPEYHADILAMRYALTSGPQLAGMAARNVIEPDAARAAAARTGTSGATFDNLYRAALEPPGIAQLLDMRNRGIIDSDAELVEQLRRHGLGERAEEVARLREYQLPPTDLIRLMVREVFNPQKRAALDLDAEFPEAVLPLMGALGITETNARRLWAGHWDLPSYSQLAEMLFRTDMDSAEFRDSLAAIDIAPKWRARFEQIARRIPTMSDFQRLARREVFNPAQRRALDLDAEFPQAFADKAALHGMTRDDAEDLWAGGWRLPSATQGYRMLWRNEIDEAGLDGLLKALDYAPTWRDKLANIARPTLGRIDIRRALAAGELTPAEGRARYQRLGLTADDAALMVRLASTSTSSNVRELTATQLTAEYEGGFITDAEYAERLDGLGFAPEDAAMYRELGASRRVARARDQTLSTIRAAFVGHRLQESEARARLDATGLLAEARERVWAEWQAQRGANAKVLTPTQIRKLYANATIGEAEAIAELGFRGYSEREARRMLAL